MEVSIHPFGTVDRNLLDAVRITVEDRFDSRTTIGEELTVPAQAYSRERGQHLSTSFLNLLAEHPRDEGQTLLGVVAVDLYVPELNFVFGEASSADRVAVFSVARLYSDSGTENEREEKVRRRAATEAVHELGHIFNLKHCSRPNCVMWFSNTLIETDLKGSRFCARHSKELKQAMR